MLLNLTATSRCGVRGQRPPTAAGDPALARRGAPRRPGKEPLANTTTLDVQATRRPAPPEAKAASPGAHVPSAAALHMPLSMATICCDPDAFAKRDGHAEQENLSSIGPAPPSPPSLE